MQKTISTFLDSKNLHHAYIINGSPQKIYPLVCRHLEDHKICLIKGNPDFVYEEYIVLSVKDARNLCDKQLRVIAPNKKRFFVISFESITLEAQNALLKVLEEPVANTHFIFISEGLQNILPTVFSRVVFVNNLGQADFATDLALAFLKSTHKKRGEIATKIINNYKETNSKSELLNLIYGLMIYFKQNKKVVDRFEILELLSDLERYTKAHGSSIKNITDALCCLLPKI